MIYLVQHDRIGLAVCAALLTFALRVWWVGRRTARNLDVILGPERLAHVRRDQAYRRMTR